MVCGIVIRSWHLPVTFVLMASNATDRFKPVTGRSLSPTMVLPSSSTCRFSILLLVWYVQANTSIGPWLCNSPFYSLLTCQRPKISRLAMAPHPLLFCVVLFLLLLRKCLTRVCIVYCKFRWYLAIRHIYWLITFGRYPPHHYCWVFPTSSC